MRLLGVFGLFAIVIAGIGAHSVSAESETIISFDAGAAEFPEGVAVADDGAIYVSFLPLAQLVRIAPGSENVEVVGAIEGLQEGDLGMLGVEIGPDGGIYTSVSSTNPEANGVWRFDAETGEATLVDGTESVGLANDMTFDEEGNMYVSDMAGGAIWIVPAGGSAEQWIQDPLITGDAHVGIGFPLGANGLALIDSTLYVGVTELGTVVSIPVEDDGSAGTPELFVEFESENGLLVDGVATDAEGNLYVTHLNTHQVVRVAPDGTVETIATADDGLNGPASVEISTSEEGSETAFVTNLSEGMAPLAPPGEAGPGIVTITLDEGL